MESPPKETKDIKISQVEIFRIEKHSNLNKKLNGWAE